MPENTPRRNTALEIATVLDGRTHKEIAAAADLSSHGFSRIVGGAVQPRPATRQRIAAALGVEVDSIFPGAVPA
jgi:hypothetical protein